MGDPGGQLSGQDQTWCSVLNRDMRVATEAYDFRWRTSKRAWSSCVRGQDVESY